jgi:hypothetical protein
MGEAAAMVIQLLERNSSALKDDGDSIRALGRRSFGDVADGHPSEEIHFQRG